MTTITVVRESIELEDLVIPETCAESSGFWLGQEVIRPTFVPRYRYAPDSDFVAGRQLMGAVRDQGLLTFSVYLRAENAVARETLKQELEDAFWQFSYQVKFNDGVEVTYAADPAIPNWGALVPAHERLAVAVGILSVPINPIGAP